jgi:hypothetical protein
MVASCWVISVQGSEADPPGIDVGVDVGVDALGEVVPSDAVPGAVPVVEDPQAATMTANTARAPLHPSMLDRIICTLSGEARS